jgi:hypothetical protein
MLIFSVVSRSWNYYCDEEMPFTETHLDCLVLNVGGFFHLISVVCKQYGGKTLPKSLDEIDNNVANPYFESFKFVCVLFQVLKWQW